MEENRKIMKNTNKNSKNWKKIEKSMIKRIHQIVRLLCTIFEYVSLVLCLPFCSSQEGIFLLLFFLLQHHIICYCESLSSNKTFFSYFFLYFNHTLTYFYEIVVSLPEAVEIKALWNIMNAPKIILIHTQSIRSF